MYCGGRGPAGWEIWRCLMGAAATFFALKNVSWHQIREAVRSGCGRIARSRRVGKRSYPAEFAKSTGNNGNRRTESGCKPRICWVSRFRLVGLGDGNRTGTEREQREQEEKRKRLINLPFFLLPSGLRSAFFIGWLLFEPVALLVGALLAGGRAAAGAELLAGGRAAARC